MTRLPLALALLALALPAAAQTAPGAAGRSGLTAFGSLGGGGALAGSASDATHRALFELEAGAGYDVGQGLRPELALVLGLAPSSLLGLRPGARYQLEGLPFQVRGALDFAAPGGSWRMRWVLAGAAAEVRVTDQLSFSGEADLGIPVASKAGFGFLFRAGLSVRL